MMKKPVATKEFSMVQTKRQVDAWDVASVVSAISRVISDANADAEKICDVAHAACQTLKQFPQIEPVSEALRWAISALKYDEDASLASWCLQQALEALLKIFSAEKRSDSQKSSEFIMRVIDDLIEKIRQSAKTLSWRFDNHPATKREATRDELLELISIVCTIDLHTELLIWLALLRSELSRLVRTSDLLAVKLLLEYDFLPFYGSAEHGLSFVLPLEVLALDWKKEHWVTIDGQICMPLEKVNDF